MRHSKEIEAEIWTKYGKPFKHGKGQKKTALAIPTKNLVRLIAKLQARIEKLEAGK